MADKNVLHVLALCNGNQAVAGIQDGFVSLCKSILVVVGLEVVEIAVEHAYHAASVEAVVDELGDCKVPGQARKRVRSARLVAHTLQRNAHLIERGGELADLVVTHDGNADVELPLRQEMRGIVELAQRKEDHTGEQDREPEMDGDNDKRDHQALPVQVVHLLVDVDHVQCNRGHADFVAGIRKRNVQVDQLCLAVDHVVEQFVLEALLGDGHVDVLHVIDAGLGLRNGLVVFDIDKYLSRLTEQGDVPDAQRACLTQDFVDIRVVEVAGNAHGIVDTVLEIRALELTVEDRVLRNEIELVLEHHEHEDRHVENGDEKVDDRGSQDDGFCVDSQHWVSLANVRFAILWQRRIR